MEMEITTASFGNLTFRGFKKPLESMINMLKMGKEPTSCGFGQTIHDCTYRRNGLCYIMKDEFSHPSCGYHK